jgi:alpha-aminoadipate carrier protein LysW
MAQTQRTVECPECGSAVQLPQDVVQNEIVGCGACGAELEVVRLDPLQVELAPQEEEDWGE